MKDEGNLDMRRSIDMDHDAIRLAAWQAVKPKHKRKLARVIAAAKQREQPSDPHVYDRVRSSLLNNSAVGEDYGFSPQRCRDIIGAPLHV